jgi:hypothetical protein
MKSLNTIYKHRIKGKGSYLDRFLDNLEQDRLGQTGEMPAAAYEVGVGRGSERENDYLPIRKMVEDL